LNAAVSKVQVIKSESLSNIECSNLKAYPTLNAAAVSKVQVIKSESLSNIECCCRVNYTTAASKLYIIQSENLDAFRSDDI